MEPTPSLPSLLNRLSRLPGELENLVGGWRDAPRGWLAQSYPYPLVNVREETDVFHVEAEVPGVAPGRVEVFVSNGTELTIEGERPAADAAGTWHRRERGAGHFRRVLTLPAAVDADKVEARLEHGVLRLTLPKAEAVRPRRINVQGEPPPPGP
jgi:HSP20 family protein